MSREVRRNDIIWLCFPGKLLKSSNDAIACRIPLGQDLDVLRGNGATIQVAEDPGDGRCVSNGHRQVPAYSDHDGIGILERFGHALPHPDMRGVRYLGGIHTSAVLCRSAYQ